MNAENLIHRYSYTDPLGQRVCLEQETTVVQEIGKNGVSVKHFVNSAKQKKVVVLASHPAVENPKNASADHITAETLHTSNPDQDSLLEGNKLAPSDFEIQKIISRLSDAFSRLNAQETISAEELEEYVDLKRSQNSHTQKSQQQKDHTPEAKPKRSQKPPDEPIVQQEDDDSQAEVQGLYVGRKSSNQEKTKEDQITQIRSKATRPIQKAKLTEKQLLVQQITTETSKVTEELPFYMKPSSWRVCRDVAKIQMTTKKLDTLAEMRRVQKEMQAQAKQQEKLRQQLEEQQASSQQAEQRIRQLQALQVETQEKELQLQMSTKKLQQLYTQASDEQSRLNKQLRQYEDKLALTKSGGEDVREKLQEKQRQLAAESQALKRAQEALQAEAEEKQKAEKLLQSTEAEIKQLQELIQQKTADGEKLKKQRVSKIASNIKGKIEKQNELQQQLERLQSEQDTEAKQQQQQVQATGKPVSYDSTVTIGNQKPQEQDQLNVDQESPQETPTEIKPDQLDEKALKKQQEELRKAQKKQEEEALKAQKETEKQRIAMEKQHEREMKLQAEKEQQFQRERLAAEKETEKKRLQLDAKLSEQHRLELERQQNEERLKREAEQQQQQQPESSQKVATAVFVPLEESTKPPHDLVESSPNEIQLGAVAAPPPPPPKQTYQQSAELSDILARTSEPDPKQAKVEINFDQLVPQEEQANVRATRRGAALQPGPTGSSGTDSKFDAFDQEPTDDYFLGSLGFK